jgi:hypothetical protein
MKLEKVKSTKCTEIAHFEVNIYKFAGSFKQTISWMCKKRSCSGCLYTNFENEIISKKFLNHDQNAEKLLNL